MATLTIPRKWAPRMRLAALAELADEGRGLKGESESAAQALRKAAFERLYSIGSPQADDHIVADVIGMARSARETAAVAEQVCSGEQEIEGAADALANLLDSLYRRIVAEELAELDGPFPTDENAVLVEIIEVLGWAQSEVGRLYGDWTAERAQKAAA